MIAYVDTSVLLRVVLQQANPLAEWRAISRGVSSMLIRIEAQRALDRLRVNSKLTDEEYAAKRLYVRQALDTFQMLPLDEATLDAAAMPAPHTLRTLDALHLTTALRYRRAAAIDTFATHDTALANVARANGFAVIGV